MRGSRGGHWLFRLILSVALVACTLWGGAAGAPFWWYDLSVLNATTPLSVDRAMPVMNRTDVGAASHPAVVVLRDFVVPAGLTCYTLSIDLPLVRWLPTNVSEAVAPGRAFFYIWRTEVAPVGSWAYASSQLWDAWQGTQPWNRTWEPARLGGTYRFLHRLPDVRVLDGGAQQALPQRYWLGVSFEQTALAADSSNWLGWMEDPAPAADSTNTFRYVDVLGNFLTPPALSAPQVLMTTAPTGTALYTGVQGVAHVAFSLRANCTASGIYQGALVASDVLVDPQIVLASSAPVPSPSPVASPAASPSPSASSAVPSPAVPSPAVPSPAVPSPVVQPSPSAEAPSPAVPSPAVPSPAVPSPPVPSPVMPSPPIPSPPAVPSPEPLPPWEEEETPSPSPVVVVIGGPGAESASPSALPLDDLNATGIPHSVIDWTGYSAYFAASVVALSVLVVALAGTCIAFFIIRRQRHGKSVHTLIEEYRDADDGRTIELEERSDHDVKVDDGTLEADKSLAPQSAISDAEPETPTSAGRPFMEEVQIKDEEEHREDARGRLAAGTGSTSDILTLRSSAISGNRPSKI